VGKLIRRGSNTNRSSSGKRLYKPFDTFRKKTEDVLRQIPFAALILDEVGYIRHRYTRTNALAAVYHDSLSLSLNPSIFSSGTKRARLKPKTANNLLAGNLWQSITEFFTFAG